MTVIATNPYGFYTKANALTDKTFSAIFLSSDKHCKVIKSSAGNKKNPTNTSYCKKKTFKKCTNNTAETDKKISLLSHNVMKSLSLVVKGVKNNPGGGTSCFSPDFKSVIPHPSLPILVGSSHLPLILSGFQPSILHDDFRLFNHIQEPTDWLGFRGCRQWLPLTIPPISHARAHTHGRPIKQEECMKLKSISIKSTQPSW